AAFQQGKFWEYEDALFEQQNNLDEELYLAIAQDVNLDLENLIAIASALNPKLLLGTISH
ncbi:MAG: disulfide bond formation protein DsbA, partial [Moorea sp. SIO2I5]|nr:disulfide bond formation protein DsbA [Moorena sp. SIO2I5]